LVLALRNSSKAQRRFRAITTALRRQIVRYLVAVKSQETLERRVSRFVARWERLEPVRKAKAKKGRKGGK